MGELQEHGTDGKSGEGLAAELLAIKPERNESAPPPFVLELTQEDRAAFTGVMDKFSLTHMVRDVEGLARHHERRGRTLSESERSIINKLTGMTDDQRQKGRELNGLDLQFRWVSATPDVSVAELMESAYTHGGNSPTDKSSWVHVGVDAVEGFMANPQHANPGVLLIYDGSKLTPITQADKDAGWENFKEKRTYTYAQKPIPELELKDALIGMISFDTPHGPDEA
ncbi:MAG: hypothetical protein JWN01_1250 [Patescibacteria group bacterium]|nr:hypothetical protein [Patescibacteria group bacterium]